MKFFSIIFFLWTTSLLASVNEYFVEMEFSLNGKTIISGKRLMKEAEFIMISEKNNYKDYYVEIVAKNKIALNSQPISMNFIVGTLEANGAKHIISKPQMTVKENEQANITLGPEQNGNKEYVTLSVMVRRVYRDQSLLEKK